MIQHVINGIDYYESNSRVYTIDKKVAVLYAPDVGAGWSTWNSTYYPTQEGLERLTFCPQLVLELLKNPQRDLSDLAETIFPEVCSCPKLVIEWVPLNTKFKILVNDVGQERVETISNYGWITA